MGSTYIIYSEEDSNAVLDLSDFLRNYCGVSCDIDQYHTNENITQWGVWNEDKVKKHAESNGFVLLVCSPKMYQQLSKPDVCSRIQMKPGHIDTLALNNLIKDQSTTHCIIPVCLEKKDMKIVPSSLRERTIYSLSFGTLKVDPQTDIDRILDMPELESLRSLVYRLNGIRENDKPPLGKAYFGSSKYTGSEIIFIVVCTCS